MVFKFLTFCACFRERAITITPLKLKCQMEDVQEQHRAVIKPVSSIRGT